ncbi:hypothetical protein [Krasilnikovia sp. M28-CT-15]|uniref:hypothetical protein n=1 Tax=Krasilnikovia sp. M28-CT-15 TaxID=3373540 RepID=UPI003876BA94
MSARKLSRLAGLVFVLAALLGGAGASTVAAEHGTGGPAIAATQQLLGDTVWA